MYVYVRTYVNIHTTMFDVCAYMYIYIYIYGCTLYTKMSRYMCRHGSIQMHIFRYIQVYIYIYIRLYPHIYQPIYVQVYACVYRTHPHVSASNLGRPTCNPLEKGLCQPSATFQALLANSALEILPPRIPEKELMKSDPPQRAHACDCRPA